MVESPPAPRPRVILSPIPDLVRRVGLQLSSDADAGTYTVAGNVVAIQSNNGSVINGTIKGDTFTVAAGGIAYEFKKQ